VRRTGLAVITFNQVPAINHSFKYELLGQLAIENRRQYCERHGYRFISEVPIASDRPACWAKIPAILQAFETHPWVLWADSDALVFDHTRPIDDLLDTRYDLIVQSHEHYFRFIGIPTAVGLMRMPINTGVFLMRASEWSRNFLQRAYKQAEFVFQGEIWNGIGEQEAMIALLRKAPEDQRRIKYVDGLQNHPRFYKPGDRFVHFYGNHAKHHIPLAECEDVLRRWRTAIRRLGPPPTNLARFHWCCIQNKRGNAPFVRGDLSHYLYAPEDIAPNGRDGTGVVNGAEQ
jgi:galactosyl transferase GMA12/MNN10 family